MRYQEGSLFDAPQGSYLVHACNCVGRWGSGIALEFAKRFPESYKQYKAKCAYGAKPGDVFICDEENGYRVVCLFTSKGYAGHQDNPLDPAWKIIEATKRCLQKLPLDRPLHMPMINSGMFRVPWPHTAALFIQYDDLDITVWHL